MRGEKYFFPILNFICKTTIKFIYDVDKYNNCKYIGLNRGTPEMVCPDLEVTASSKTRPMSCDHGHMSLGDKWSLNRCVGWRIPEGVGHSSYYFFWRVKRSEKHSNECQ